jgi:hypothetical protein
MPRTASTGAGAWFAGWIVLPLGRPVARAARPRTPYSCGQRRQPESPVVDLVGHGPSRTEPHGRVGAFATVLHASSLQLNWIAAHPLARAATRRETITDRNRQGVSLVLARNCRSPCDTPREPEPRTGPMTAQAPPAHQLPALAGLLFASPTRRPTPGRLEPGALALVLTHKRSSRGSWGMSGKLGLTGLSGHTPSAHELRNAPWG